MDKENSAFDDYDTIPPSTALSIAILTLPVIVVVNSIRWALRNLRGWVE